MKEEIQEDKYFFVDESGDTVFQNRNGKWIVGEKNGASPILIIGMIKTNTPEKLRKSIEELREKVIKDSRLKDIPSMAKTKKAFHAKDDCPMVREKVYDLLKELPFTCNIVVMEKTKEIFEELQENPRKFYDYLLSELFKKTSKITPNSKIYIATRGKRKREEHLKKAIQHEVIPQAPSGEVCLQVIDYCNWAVQRAFLKNDRRYYQLLKSKFESILILGQKEDKPFTARY